MATLVENFWNDFDVDGKTVLNGYNYLNFGEWAVEYQKVLKRYAIREVDSFGDIYKPQQYLKVQQDLCRKSIRDTVTDTDEHWCEATVELAYIKAGVN